MSLRMQFMTHDYWIYVIPWLALNYPYKSTKSFMKVFLVICAHVCQKQIPMQEWICLKRLHTSHVEGDQFLNSQLAGNWQLLDRIVQNFKMHCFGNWIWCVVFRRLVLFRRCLDAEMKDGVWEGLHNTWKKEEKEFVSKQEEATFWEKKFLGTTSAKSLLSTIYFYNGKVERIICRPIVVVSNDLSGKYTVLSIKTDKNSSFLISFWTNRISWSVCSLGVKIHAPDSIDASWLGHQHMNN